MGLKPDYGSGGPSDIRKDSQGNSCTDVGGLMDRYFCESGFSGFFSCLTDLFSPQSMNRFTGCSKEDYAKYYQDTLTTHRSFCLETGKNLIN